MRYHVQHITEYHYQYPTTLCYNKAWMTPRELPYQQIHQTRLEVSPVPATLRPHRDFFGNQVHFFSVSQPHLNLRVEAHSDITRSLPPYLQHNAWPQTPWEAVAELFRGLPEGLLDVKAYTLPSPLVSPSASLQQLALEVFQPGQGLYDGIWQLTQYIYREFTYQPDFTTVATPLEEVLKARKGVCQDFAQVAIGCLRSLGLPARYVSGYIETLPPEGEEALLGAAASHAWFSAYLPEVGWVDFDPTNNKLAGLQHISVAWGRDYSDVPPLKGVIFNGNEHELRVEVNVLRQADAPASTAAPPTQEGPST